MYKVKYTNDEIIAMLGINSTIHKITKQRHKDGKDGNRNKLRVINNKEYTKAKIRRLPKREDYF